MAHTPSREIVLAANGQISARGGRGWFRRRVSILHPSSVATRLYAGRTVGRHHDHRHPDCAVAAGGAGGARGGAHGAMRQQSEAVGHRAAQLSRQLHRFPMGASHAGGTYTDFFTHFGDGHGASATAACSSRCCRSSNSRTSSTTVTSPAHRLLQPRWSGSTGSRAVGLLVRDSTLECPSDDPWTDVRAGTRYYNGMGAAGMSEQHPAGSNYAGSMGNQSFRFRPASARTCFFPTARGVPPAPSGTGMHGQRGRGPGPGRRRERHVLPRRQRPGRPCQSALRRLQPLRLGREHQRDHRRHEQHDCHRRNPAAVRSTPATAGCTTTACGSPPRRPSTSRLAPGDPCYTAPTRPGETQWVPKRGSSRPIRAAASSSSATARPISSARTSTT